MTIIDDLLSIVSGKPVKGSVLDIFGKPQPPTWVVLVNRRPSPSTAMANDTDRRDPSPQRPISG